MNKFSTNLVVFILAFACTTVYGQEEEDGENLDILVLEEEKKKSAIGSFGTALARNTSFVNFNGYVTNEFIAQEGATNTFDNHYFNVFVSTQLTEKISAEAQLEYEHGGEEIQLRYGFVDYKISEALVIRSGKFLTPAGEFNEYLYPEYIAKTTQRAYINRQVSPSAWGEVGVQLRGVINEWSEKLVPYYTLYVVNGLEGEPGAGIRSLRNNSRDKNDNSKAIGGSMGVEVNKVLKVSANYYQGAYSTDGQLDLSIFGLSFYLNKEKLSIWSEVQAAAQEAFEDDAQTQITTLDKWGFYILAGYKITEKFEPVVRFDQIKLDGDPTNDLNRFTLGLNIFIGPTAVVRANYDFVSNDGESEKDDNQFSIQLSVGF